MKKLTLLALALGLGMQAQAFDLNSAVDAGTKAAADPKGALNQAGTAAGSAAGDKAAATLTEKLKNVQNEKGPIVFVTGKATLDAAKCEKTLKSIDGLIKQFPGFKVTIEGHTDTKGKAASNQKLSQARAEAVRQWLVDHLQTPSDRMAAKGFGGTKPIADNKTEAGRAKNRRVDFSVSKM